MISPDILPRKKTIAVTIYRSIYRFKLISVKYRRYIAIFAIFDDYRFHYFCTILYVPYNSFADPDPEYFKQILESSLSEEQMRRFCSDFLALFQPKEHKQPVPCATGASDSGKTSLFSPVFQIVPLCRIAHVTKQKSFNKSMIDSTTEVIFLDVAYTNLFDIDDWKIICQGGFTSHDVKWKKAQGFHCRTSTYITCQQEMDFGEAHNDAMNRRLNKYFFQSLPHVELEANQWLPEHAMDCIVWAQKMAATCPTTTLTAMVWQVRTFNKFSPSL